MATLSTYLSARESTALRLKLAMMDLLEATADSDGAMANAPHDPQVAARESRRLSTFTICTIFSATAWVEAAINEVFLAAAEKQSGPSSLGLARAAQDLLSVKWICWRECNTDPPVAEKASHALKALGIEHPISHLPTIKEFKILIELRNALTHAKPEYLVHAHGPHPSDDKKRFGRLQNDLFGRFPEARGRGPAEMFMWTRCLGLGCAEWTVKIATEFFAEWSVALMRKATAI